MVANRDYLTITRETARQLKLLDANDELIPLDSLAVIDFVVALETATDLAIQAERLQPEAFESLATVVALLERCGDGTA
jgi:acyl carrier protein